MTRLNKAGFLPTRWSLIAAVRGGDSVLAQEAPGTLCQAYWYPLYAYVRRVEHAALMGVMHGARASRPNTVAAGGESGSVMTAKRVQVRPAKPASREAGREGKPGEPI